MYTTLRAPMHYSAITSSARLLVRGPKVPMMIVISTVAAAMTANTPTTPAPSLCGSGSGRPLSFSTVRSIVPRTCAATTVPAKAAEKRR